jgi:hypothetical protein
MLKTIPFYVVAFNRIKGLKSAKEFVDNSSVPLTLIVLDMGSTWEPFLEFRDSLGVKVHHYPKGMGPRDLWTSGKLEELGEGEFFLSDGDIDYSHVSSFAAEQMIQLSREYPWFPKIGLALKINDLPSDLEGNRIRDWAKGDWAVPWDDQTFLTGLDTTIAYYPRREKRFYYRPALRIASKFQATHYPWYERPENYDEEVKFYMNLASPSVSSGQARLLTNRSFKIKRQIWLLLYKILKSPLKTRILGKVCVKILSFRGTITPKH